MYHYAQVKRDNKASPSRVVHIRNLANEALDAEVLSLALPFGRVNKYLMLKGKNQVRTEQRTANIDNENVQHLLRRQLLLWLTVTLNVTPTLTLILILI